MCEFREELLQERLHPRAMASSSVPGPNLAWVAVLDGDPDAPRIDKVLPCEAMLHGDADPVRVYVRNEDGDQFMRARVLRAYVAPSVAASSAAAALTWLRAQPPPAIPQADKDAVRAHPRTVPEHALWAFQVAAACLRPAHRV